MRAPVDPEKIRRLLREIGLVRYPSLDAEAFVDRVQRFLAEQHD